MDANKVVISLHKSLDTIEKDWLLLQETGLCTVYQSFEWCKAWHDTAGQARRTEPSVICGHQQDGTPVFILPFTVTKAAGVRLLRWFGAAEATYSMGIFDKQYLARHPDVVEQAWPDILQSLGNIDSISLDNQPEKLNGIDNPLRFLFTTRAANQSHRMALNSDYQALYESKRSSSSRRSARKRDKKLAALNNVTFGLPEAGSPAYDLINTMINHQQDRLGAKGIRSVYDETRRAFLQQLVKSKWQNGTNVVRPYHLTIDGEVCAVMLGGYFQSTYWALISSLTPDQRLHSISPGDYALRKTIQTCCEEGFVTFDFAAGDTEYKSHWSDETVALFETNKAVTAKGAAVAKLVSVATGAKRSIKQTPWLFSLAKAVREMLFKKTS